MSADYVSFHARLLDGVRQARIRAIGEMKTDVGQFSVGCFYHKDIPAQAMLVHHDSDVPVPVCDEHLKSHMADYRADPDMYPPAVVPLKRRRV